MKPLNLQLNIKHLVSFVILSMVSLAIWFGSPTVVIGNHFPFRDPIQRIYLISILYLLWALKICLLDANYPQIMRFLSPENFKKLQLLRSRFKGAVQFLKKNRIHKQGKDVHLFHLPWYLVIGPQGAGKTTLLANANVNFVLAKQFKKENLKQLSPSDNCDWWVTRDLVLIDVPSHFIFEEKTDKKQITDFLWQSMLDLTQKFRRKKSLNGVVITLNLHELIRPENQPKRESILIALRNSILQIKTKFTDNIPFYLVITKCDLIPGFVEFFGDSSSDELAQTCGITIPPVHENGKLIDVFVHRFNALIKRLNKQLLWRLHQERNQNVRPAIKDFPLQIERLKEAICNLIKTINSPDLNLQGVYLTSAMQLAQNEERTTENSIIQYQATQSGIQLYSPTALPSRSFFIKQLILQGLLNTFEHPALSSTHEVTWEKRITYTTALSAIAFAAIILGHDFQQSVQQAYSLQNLLSQYQTALRQEPTEINHLLKALPLLGGLEEATKQSNPNLTRFSNIITFYTRKSQKTAEQIYHQALQTIVIPEIKSYLENYLHNSADKNPIQSYAALKAYLMLGDPKNLQVTFVSDMLNQILPNSFDKQQRQELANHLQTALNEMQPVTLDNHLVAEARNFFVGLSRVQLAFIILKNDEKNNLNSSVSLGTNIGSPPALTTKSVENQIPNMFTAQYFQTILSNDIPIAAMQALRGNNVLGELPTTTFQDTELKQELEKQYIANYVDIWESLLANIQINSPHNLNELNLILTNLTSDTSPLIQLLQTIQQNTTPTQILNASPKFQALNNLLLNINNQGNTLYQIFVGLKELNNYLQPILQASNTGEAALNMARIRMQSIPLNDAITHLKIIAEQSPEPIQSWLQKLTVTTWHAILEEASRSIQTHWKTSVIAHYNGMADQFPFKADAASEADLQQFINLFNPQGTLVSFYHAYLSPFVNESSKEWDWKRVDNQQLSFSKSILQKMQYAFQLQQAIFPNGDNKLFINFTLQPISLDKYTSNITLNINGQSISYQKSSPHTAHVLTWPGNHPMHTTSIDFSTDAHRPLNETYQGDWAWFRLVNKATQNIISGKELLLSLTVDNHTAKYKLFTQGHPNPFLPLNWEKLQLPEELS